MSLVLGRELLGGTLELDRIPMNLRRTWNWATMACGLIVLVADYVNGAQLAVYFDEHAMFNNNGLSGVPSIVLGIVGIGLVVGGATAALQERK